MRKKSIIHTFQSVTIASICLGLCYTEVQASSPPGKNLSTSINHGALRVANFKERTITGTVLSKNDGAPLPGVNVIVKGTQTGSTTDNAGKFSISFDDTKSNALVFSYIGFETQEVVVGNQSVINLTLSEDVSMLDEAVVTALGIKRETKSLTYSIGKVDGEQLVKVAQENLVNSLAGRVAGLTLNQTGGVGSSVSIVIRGATSLSNDNQPLFVIDGIPMVNRLNNVATRGDRNNVDYGNVISDINPEDVESMTVLKGPAAAALYGSRAGNGVILITTKSGKNQKGLGVSFSTNNVFETPYRYLDMHYKHANGSRINSFSQGSAYWAGPELDKGNMAVQWDSPVDANGVKIPTELRSYKDNMKNFLQTGITTSNTVAVSGSNYKGHFRVSYDHMKNRGIIPNSDLKRNSISTSSGYKLTDKVTLSTNFTFVNSAADNRPSTGNRGTNPLEAVYTWSNVDVRKLRNYWDSGAENIRQLSPTANQDNPYFLAYGVNNSYNRNHAYGNVKLDWTITPTLSAYVRATHDVAQQVQETKIPWSYSRATQGAYHYDKFGNGETNLEAMISYRKKISDFDVVINGGTNSMKRSSESIYVGGTPLTIPGLYRITNVPTTARNTVQTTSLKRIYSLFATTNIGYKDQIYLDLSARNDWSSTLPIANRSYFYHSEGLSWLPSHTFKLPRAISMLKLYVNMAQTGNDTDPYQLNNALGTSNWGDLITTNMPGTLLNPTLKPEIQTSREFGLNFNLFQNRVRFEGTYFNMTNKNQILDIKTSPGSGYSASKINAGQLSSRGLEISLGFSPIRDKKGFNMDVNLNFTRIRTRIDELYKDMQYYTLWEDNGGGAFTWVGEDIGNIYSRGYLQVTDPTSKYYKWPILNKTGDYQPDNAFTSREKIGNFNPNFILGGQVNLNYKKFNMSMSFDWRAGGDFLSFSYRYMESDWRSKRQLDQLIPGGLYSSDELVNLLKSDPEKYVIPTNGHFPRVGGHTKETGGMPYDGANDGGFIPGVIAIIDEQTKQVIGYEEHLGGPGTQVREISDAFPWSYNKAVTFDASFVKLREISFGYNLPNIYGFHNINLSVYSRNIMLWTAAKVGIDPERAYQNDAGKFKQGIELYNVNPWTFPIGFKVNFSF